MTTMTITEPDDKIVTIYKDRRKEWRWRVENSRGRKNILCDSGQGYATPSAALKGYKTATRWMLQSFAPTSGDDFATGDLWISPQGQTMWDLGLVDYSIDGERTIGAGQGASDDLYLTPADLRNMLAAGWSRWRLPVEVLAR